MTSTRLGLPVLMALFCSLLVSGVHAQGDTLNYPTESRQMACEYSGQLWPPDSLARVFDAELTLLRKTWHDSLPIVRTQFSSPWEPLFVSCSPVRAEELLTGKDTLFAKMVRDYGLSLERAHVVRIYFQSSKPINMCRLADKLAELPGQQVLNLWSWTGPPKPCFVRVVDGPQVKYFFRGRACPDVDHSYYYFLIQRDSARFMGSHWECPPHLDSLNLDSLAGKVRITEYLAKWADSSEAHRPAWVDTARKAITDFEKPNTAYHPKAKEADSK